MSYELNEAIRLAESVLHGNSWTGKLDKREVDYAVRRLISVARNINRENLELKRKSR